MKYRKKPVVIEAFQFTENLALNYLCGDHKLLPFDLHVSSAEYHSDEKRVYNAYISIETLEGIMKANIGDWIIKGLKGELYPCKDDIFQATYDPVAPDTRKEEE
jgi:hypothetical protein